MSNTDILTRKVYLRSFMKNPKSVKLIFLAFLYIDFHFYPFQQTPHDMMPPIIFGPIFDIEYRIRFNTIRALYFSLRHFGAHSNEIYAQKGYFLPKNAHY